MKCRHCNNLLSAEFINLGSAPPSNAYLSQEALGSAETWYPLRVLICDQCWLVQTEDYTGRESFFSDQYAYFSSTSSSWLAHSRKYVEQMVTQLSLNSSSTVIEVAANDGYLLQYFQDRLIPCLGIEPTESTAQAAIARGLEINQSFFGIELARELKNKGKAADLIIANNVLAHVPDINDFVSGFTCLLKPDGVATFEFPYLLELVKYGQFDTIYHEHFSYLSLTAVNSIFQSQGLSIFNVEHLPTHGGSLRVFARKASAKPEKPNESVSAILKSEADKKVNQIGFYQGLQQQAEKSKIDLLQFLIEVKENNKSIVGYGAAAKGNTLLNFAGVRPDLLPAICDAAHSKQGMFMPGSRIPIMPPKYIDQIKPDYILILPWNIQNEVMDQLSNTRDWGAKFVVAIPELHILEPA